MTSEATRTRPLVTPDQVAAELEATSYAELLDELGAFAARQASVADRDRLLRQVGGLGSEDTIAVGGGAFLSHLRSDAVEDFAVAVGRTARPLRVPSETGEDARGRLFALVVAPDEASAEYLETVASMTTMLRQPGAVEAILDAPDAEAIAGLDVVRNAPRVQKLSVIDVMEPASHRIYADMDLEEAARVLVRGGTTGLPVVNKNDEIVGMISEKDVIRDLLPDYLKLVETGGRAKRAAEGRTVKDVMSKTVMCLSTDAGISEAASIIVNKNLDPLPLTREGKWVGSISRRSLIRKLLQF